MRQFTGCLRDGRLVGEPAPERHDDCRILWRGHVANVAALRAEAAARGHQPAGRSPGELFAWAYRRWGADLQAHVTGEYALAVQDDRDGTLVLTHDALGLLPLFYRPDGGGLHFASHLESLAGGAGWGGLDPEYLADYLANPCQPRERTPYRGIRRLAPGRTLVMRQGRLTERRTWDLAGVSPYPLPDHRAYEERLRAVVQEAVVGALPDEGPAWVELSGGMDSTTVAGLAHQAGARDLAAVSLVFPRHRRADETAWIRAALDAFRLPWHAVDGDAAPPFGELPDRFCAEPGLGLIHWGWRRRFEELLTAHGVEVLLTGQGGDLVFFGPGAEPYYLADLARGLRPGRLLAELKRWRQADPGRRSLGYWLRHYVAGPAVRHALGRALRRPGHPGTSPWIRADYARRLDLAGRCQVPAVWRSPTVGGQWFGEALAATCALVAAQNQAAAGYERRHPLLARPLVEFVHAIPWEEKLRPGTDRCLQRGALPAVLPEATLKRRGKASLDQPYTEGLRRGRAWLAALTDEPRLAELGVVEPRLWREAVEQARAGRVHHLPQFEAAATLEVWLRQFEGPRTTGHRRPGVSIQQEEAGPREVRAAGTEAGTR